MLTKEFLSVYQLSIINDINDNHRENCFTHTAQKICDKLRIWSHLLKKSLMENFIFCALSIQHYSSNHWEVFCRNEVFLPGLYIIVDIG